MVLARCDCGTERKINLRQLTGGNSRSCGCYQSEVSSKTMTVHGMSFSREYRSWACMKDRVTNPNCPMFRHYGGRGITICDRWKDSFDLFYQDMGPRPAGTSIDRINNNLGYEPGNCRWATRSEQMDNTRRSIRISVDGEVVNFKKAIKLLKCRNETLHKVLDDNQVLFHGHSVVKVQYNTGIPPLPNC